MATWRTIFTDSESATGVAPVCEHQNDPRHHSSGDGFAVMADPSGVYDCCPQPHIETWSEDDAQRIALRLTECDADLCS